MWEKLFCFYYFFKIHACVPYSCIISHIYVSPLLISCLPFLWLLLLHAERVYLLGSPAHELLIWLPRKDLNDDHTSWCANMCGCTLMRSLDEELEAVNESQRGRISVLRGGSSNGVSNTSGQHSKHIYE